MGGVIKFNPGFPPELGLNSPFFPKRGGEKNLNFNYHFNFQAPGFGPKFPVQGNFPGKEGPLVNPGPGIWALVGSKRPKGPRGPKRCFPNFLWERPQGGFQKISLPQFN